MFRKLKALMTYRPSGDCYHDIVIFRILMLTATSVYPMYWVLYNLLPGAVDPLVYRLAICSITLLGFACSYIPALAGRRLNDVYLAVVFALTGHLYMVLYKSGIQPIMITGLYFTILLIASTFQTKRAIALYSLYCVAWSLAYPSLGGLADRAFLTLGVLVMLIPVSMLVLNRMHLMSLVVDRELRFRRFSECAGEGLAIISGGVIIDHNDALAKMAGYESGELKGVDGPSLLAVGQAQMWLEQPYEAQAIRKNGQTFDVEISGKNFLWDGQTRRVVTVRDISERKKNEKTILEQQRMLAATAKMSALGEMAAGTAHEINNPLAIINGKAWELKKLSQNGKLTVAAATVIGDTIEATVARIAKIVKGLRAFARDGGHDDFKVVVVQGLVGDCVSFCQNRFDAHGIELRVDECQPNLSILCRPDQIMQVLINLMNNSVDAISSLHERFIELSVTSDGESVFLHVKDSGRGIPEQVADKMFQPFFTTKGPDQGTGMGLSISLGIIAAHSGELTLRDTERTEFVIRLPLAPAAVGVGAATLSA